MINVLGAGVYNPMAILGIIDCTGHIASGGIKDAPYIASLFMPFIDTINALAGTDVVDCVFFDGAGNVQNAGEILKVNYPRISVGHGAEHVVALFFSDVFSQVTAFQILDKFAKKCRNIFSSSRHAPTAIFKKHSKMHNGGVLLTLIKSSECRYVSKYLSSPTSHMMSTSLGWQVVSLPYYAFSVASLPLLPLSVAANSSN